MTTVDDRLAYIALGCLVEPGNPDLGNLILRRGPATALRMLVDGRPGSRLHGAVAVRLRTRDPLALAEEALADATRLGARIVTPADEEWPSCLADLSSISHHGDRRIDLNTYPPLCFWVRGAPRLDEALHRSVAIVGARAATTYGEFAASEMAYGLADKGWTIVSGGAYGIDTAAHRGALAADGVTVAVLACGVDRPYPASNTGLFERIGQSGLLVSEWPPAAEPHRHRFLIRNRAIAALTRGTVVVEAARRSGATQTLRRAVQLGRIAMAMPGPVTSAMSVGCHEALRMPTIRLVTGWPHVLEEVGSIGELAPVLRGPEDPRDSLDLTTTQVLEAVPRRRSAGPEAVAATAGVSLPDTLRALGLLSVLGFVIHDDGGYTRPKPPATAVPVRTDPARPRAAQ